MQTSRMGCAVVCSGTKFVTSLAVWLCMFQRMDAAESQTEMPRYKLEVGQELTYTNDGTWTRKPREGQAASPEKNSGTWKVVVMSVNDDGSWRLGIVRTMNFADNEMTNVATIDLYPDGRIAKDPDIDFQLDPTSLFVRLPTDAMQVEQGWSAESQDGTLVCSLSPESDRSEGKWVIHVQRVGPMNIVYEVDQQETVTFDTNLGRIQSIEERSRQRWGIEAETAGKVTLASVETRDAESLKQFQTDLAAYVDANQKQRTIGKAMDNDVAAATSFESDIQALWTPVLASVKEPMLRMLIESNLKSIKASSSYYLEGAKKRSESLGKPGADWTLLDLDDKEHSLKQYRGQVVILDFWYRGCGWCIRAMPALNAVAVKYADKPVAILGMNNDSDLEDAKFVAEKLALKYPSLQASDMPAKYGVQGFPTIIVLDQRGNVHDIHVGYSPDLEEELSQTIDDLLTKGLAAAGARQPSEVPAEKEVIVELAPPEEGAID